MNQLHRTFPELGLRLNHFSASTRARLSRSLIHTLRGRRPVSRSALNEAVVDGCHELRSEGLNDRDVMSFFSALVEEIGRACGADRPSLMSGELRWVPVRARVLDLVRDTLRDTLSVTAPEPFLAMDHATGPR